VGIVTHDLILKTPKLDIILRGTTLLRAFDLWPKLASKGILKGFEFCDVTPEEAFKCVEMIGFGGAHVSSIVKLDGQVVGSGTPGPIFKAFDALLSDDMRLNTDLLDSVPYSNVSSL